MLPSFFTTVFKKAQVHAYNPPSILHVPLITDRAKLDRIASYQEQINKIIEESFPEDLAPYVIQEFDNLIRDSRAELNKQARKLLHF